MHRELSTRGDRAPGPEPPGPERRVPKARTQARRVALRRWPRRKATPNRRPGTVGRLRAYLPRAPSTLGPRARRCPDSKKKPPTVEWLGFVRMFTLGTCANFYQLTDVPDRAPRVSYQSYRARGAHLALKSGNARATSWAPETQSRHQKQHPTRDCTNVTMAQSRSRASSHPRPN